MSDSHSPNLAFEKESMRFTGEVPIDSSVAHGHTPSCNVHFPVGSIYLRHSNVGRGYAPSF
uniref:Uncharacterized protein n=1 Tax=Salix viminalis TaxID=40686 RepID=A0A6N2LGE6_SALVM